MNDGNNDKVPAIYLALLHYPVLDRNGATIASAITNLDLHDLSRTARTYGVKGVFVVTPLADQQKMARRIVAHWSEGAGARHNPDRMEALRLLRVRDSLVDAVRDIGSEAGRPPRTVATSAVFRKGSIGFAECRNNMVAEGGPFLLIFGTAWGLADEVLKGADDTLAPIRGTTAYNHLPVRSAAAIILDRLAGRPVP